MPSRFRYRQDLADDLQKNGVEITDIMLAELDVWEHPVKGLAKRDGEIMVSRSNTMTAERMLGYGDIEGAFLVFRICSKDYIHYRNYPLIVFSDDKAIRIASYGDNTDAWVVSVLESDEDVLMVQMLFNTGSADLHLSKDNKNAFGHTPLKDSPQVMLCSRDPKLSEKSNSERIRDGVDQ